MKRMLLLAPAALLFALAGCVATPPEPTPAPTLEPIATPTPTPTPTPPALTIPACDALVPLATLQAAFGANTEFIAELAPMDAAGRFGIPEINAALAGATTARGCLWGIPNSDGSIVLAAAELDASVASGLQAALAAAGFANSVEGTASVFRLEREGEVSLDAATHYFTGSLWIMADDASIAVTDVTAAAALASLQAANPELGL